MQKSLCGRVRLVVLPCLRRQKSARDRSSRFNVAALRDNIVIIANIKSIHHETYIHYGSTQGASILLLSASALNGVHRQLTYIVLIK